MTASAEAICSQNPRRDVEQEVVDGVDARRRAPARRGRTRRSLRIHDSYARTMSYVDVVGRRPACSASSESVSVVGVGHLEVAGEHLAAEAGSGECAATSPCSRSGSAVTCGALGHDGVDRPSVSTVARRSAPSGRRHTRAVEDHLHRSVGGEHDVRLVDSRRSRSARSDSTRRPTASPVSPSASRHVDVRARRAGRRDRRRRTRSDRRSRRTSDLARSRARGARTRMTTSSPKLAAHRRVERLGETRVAPEPRRRRRRVSRRRCRLAA